VIKFTEAAIKKLKEAVEPGDYVRVGVAGGGCSGLSYTIEIEEGHKGTDVTFKTKNVDVCLDPYSNFTLKGVTVDYYETLHQSGFSFDNPDAKKTCGCGTSFKPQEGGPEVPKEVMGGCSTGGCGVSH